MRINRYVTNIVRTWALVLVGICLYAMFYYLFAWGTYAVIDAVESVYTFESPADAIVILIKNVIAWHPLVAIFGWFLWGFLDSMRRERREYEEY